jgi:hypothetical protein
MNGNVCNQLTEPHSNETCFIRNCTTFDDDDDDDSIYADLIVKFKNGSGKLEELGEKENFEDDLIIADVYMNASNTKLEDFIQKIADSHILKRNKRILLTGDSSKQTILENSVQTNTSESENNLNVSKELEDDDNQLVIENSRKTQEVQDIANDDTEVDLGFNDLNEKFQNESNLLNDTFGEVFNPNKELNISESFFESNTSTSNTSKSFTDTYSNFNLSKDQTETDVYDDQSENSEYAWITGEFSPVF